MALKISSVAVILRCLLLPIGRRVLKTGALLLLMAFLSTLMIRSILGRWFGFIIFLIYITGLLVLFGYILAVSPNSFQKNYPVSIRPLITVVLALVMGGALIRFKFDVSSIGNKSSFSIDVVKIFTRYNLGSYWFIGILLFIALVIAVLMSYKSPKPLRPYII